MKVLCKYNNTFYINNKGKLFVIGSTDKGVNGTGKKREEILNFEEISFNNDSEIV